MRLENKSPGRRTERKQSVQQSSPEPMGPGSAEGLTSLSSGEGTLWRAEPAAIAFVAVKGTVAFSGQWHLVLLIPCL